MADRIALKSNAFSSKSLKSALKELRSADKSLNGTLGQQDAGSVLYYSPADKYVKHLFSNTTISNADTAYGKLHKIQTELERIVGLLDSGPEEIIEADKEFKGQKSNAWQRTIIAIGGGIGGLFKHGGSKTGSESKVANWESTIIKESVEKTYKSSPTYEYWGIIDADVAAIEESSKTEEEAQQKLQQALKGKLDAAVANGHHADTSGYSRNTKYSYYDYDGVYRENWGLYEESGGCTWYAFNRYREMNNKDLVFHGAGGGNAQDWDDRIDANQFDKISTSADCNGITNAIAVDNEGSPDSNGAYYGHVAYVEAIIGDTVYMSEGWYSNGSFHQTGLRTMALSDFSAKYETLIVAK